MSGDNAETTVGNTPAPVDIPSLVVERWGQAVDARDRGIWIALGVAVLLHSTLFLGLLGHQPRTIGDADGSADGISVSVVTEADFQSKSTVATPPAAPPGQEATALAQPAPPPPPPPQEAAKEPPALKPSDFTTETIKAEPEKAEPEKTEPEKAETEKAETEKAETPAETAREIAKDVPDILALPGPGEEPKKKLQPTAKPQAAAEAKAQQKPQPPKPQPLAQPKRTAKLDLTPPPGSFSGSAGGAGRSAGFERPPGITRSGANDDFARGVIRALQQTMPQLREVLGRVTVRILLNENGNVSDVQVVRSANNPKLDQSVVFAAKQTSYPFPPPNSNLADRTFLVTYIYH